MSRNVKHQSTSKTEAIGYIGTGPAGATLATGQIEETNATKVNHLDPVAAGFPFSENRAH